MNKRYKVPAAVKKEARLGLKMHNSGFKGGTTTGWNRARQLEKCEYVTGRTIKTMKAWFARHGPDAKNGGTSYPGYRRWVRSGKPSSAGSTPKIKNNNRGAVAWLIWGGDPAYKWVKGIKI